jgi:hypothetical protein
MAEWTGRKRTLNSIEPEGVPPIDAASDHLPPPPKAPGATSSPQLPGMTPDDPELPGHERGTLLPLASNRRPLTEYGTAQRLLHLFTPAPGATLQAADWEQGPASKEEVRKADPALLTPFRPLTGYGLGVGRAAPAIAPDSFEAIGEVSEATPHPEAVPDSAGPVAHPIQATPSQMETRPPSGAIRGDGTTNCPPEYPVKGNTQSMIYHTSASSVYGRTIPELCFTSPEAAEAAGFRKSQNE